MKSKASPAGISMGLLCLVGAVHAAGQPAYAQNDPPAGVTPSAAGEEEVYVTAQRRSERLTKVPVSVSAVSGQVVEQLGITQAAQLKNVVPSLEIVDAGPIPKVAIRGIALNDFGFSNESPVSVYSNDVYIGTPVAPLAQFYDINRVEVLRGPQGTLFGRNATGGLIQIITNMPSDDYSGEASFQYGSFNQTIFELSQNIPVSDTVRTRFAFIYNRDDGYQKNVLTGTRLATTDFFGARATIEVDLGPSVVNRTILNYGRADDLGSAYSFRGTRDPVTGARCSDERVKANECVTTDRVHNDYPDPRFIYSSLREPRHFLETFGFDNTLKYTGEDFNFTSVTAYVSTETTNSTDGGAMPNPLFYTNYHAIRRQFSQEFRADGESENFSWVAGLYYYHEWVPEGFTNAPNLIAAMGTTLGLQNEFEQITDSGAAFGQADYKILPNLTLTAGIRYTYEEKSLTIADSFSRPNFTDRFDSTASIFTWKAGLDWQIHDNLLAYASVTTGFKSAAFNTSLVVKGAAAPTDPEENTSYEIGLKGQSADRRWTASIAAFHVDYREIQLVSTPSNSIGSILTNIPSADIDGIEVELAARPIDGLSLTANVAWLDTEIHAPGYIVSAIPIDGRPLPLSPEFSAKGIIRYDIDTDGMGTISPWISASYRTETYGKLPTLIVLNEIPGYTLVDAGITWTSPDDRWGVEFLVQNATDEAYYTNSPNYSGLAFVKYGEPRTFSVKLTTNW